MTSSRAWGGIFDVSSLRSRIEALEKEIADPAFWSNADKKDPVMKELKSLKSQVEPLMLLETECSDLEELTAITEEADSASLGHLETEIRALEKRSTRWSSKSFSAVRTTRTAPSFRSMPARAAPSPAIGSPCCFACTVAGLKDGATACRL